MGNSEEGKSCKPEKSSSTAPDQSNIHVYPDWAAMQAYYGPRVAVPPYVNSPVAPGHAPHPYMWGPLQPMMPPYGAPYAGIYAHGGVYAHPGVPIVSRPQAHGMTSSPAISQTMDAASLSMDTSAKSSGNTDQRTSKLKGSNGLGVSIGNCCVDNGDGTDHGPSQSGHTEGSSDGSNIHTTEAGENSKKRSRETTRNDSGDRKTQTRSSPQPREVNGATKKETSIAISPGNIAEKVVGTVFSPTMTTTPELRNHVGTLVKASPTNVSRISPAVPAEVWLQNEREIKREKRKQSNRESARRSRLRKQAEAEELAIRVQSLTSENLGLKSEINKFTENSEKLKLENAALMERLKNKRRGQAEEVTLGKIDDKRLQPVSTADLLARVNNSGPLDRTNDDSEIRENNTSGAKLHQLLDASRRTDAVAAR
ncbi:PREDICTED: transcriptional activator TAF-1-like isoform X2 [Nicotiana attenuata]|uniref:Transcriptional activator taf-1 n=1 Tax=Nicotiana attenuata TaxID=49451 RepID=A0A1J6IY51_NICAT|nr:PREDICTED: transcriptional activator TAF-1-like isoform X2 [Nicotiana attenuata]OIT00041.1 transcriptional activator taf-1 [Nicotiana attenuata]